MQYFLIMLMLMAESLYAGGVEGKKQLLFSTFEHSYLSKISEAILTQAYTELGYSVKYIELPAERGLIEVNKGGTDGETHRKSGLIADGYPNLVQIPVKITWTNLNAFASRKDIKINGWDSLQNYNFGILNGQKIIEHKTKNLKNRTVFNTQEQGIKAVGDGHFDLFVLPELSGLNILKNSPYKNKVTLVDPPIDTVELFHYLGKKNKNIVPLITTKLQELEKKGVIDSINKKFAAEIK